MVRPFCDMPKKNKNTVVILIGLIFGFIKKKSDSENIQELAP